MERASIAPMMNLVGYIYTYIYEYINLHEYKNTRDIMSLRGSVGAWEREEQVVSVAASRLCHVAAMTGIE